MENKYYTPEISEFHVGFEYEFNGMPMLLNEPYFDWMDYTEISNDPIIIRNYSVPNLVRVKYLDREDIEGLGWKYTSKSIDIWFEIEGYFDMGSWTSYKAIMHYGLHDNRMSILMMDAGLEGLNVFKGIIKNKSEFKRLMKQLGII